MAVPKPPQPSPRPCSSCPYPKDAPSGLWAVDEYEKLPRYDEPTGDQPPGMFMCHQQDGRLCAGWAGCHDMDNALSVRLAVAMGRLTPEQHEALLDYVSEVDLFESGAEAAAHGLAGIDSPDDKSRKAIAKLMRKGLITY